VSVEAYDAQTRSFVTVANADCGFGYRTSRFKVVDKGRFFITTITLRLTRSKPSPPFYESVQTYFDEKGIKDYTPQILRSAVIHVRTAKLPDPAVTPTNGSFFTNPIISAEKFKNLEKSHKDIAHWKLGDGRAKLSAGWLIEHAGFKDFHDKDTGMATSDKQALVLINEHAHKTADLLKFKDKIVSKVQDMFGITLEQEPELLGE
jgi:UDP-N-acetylmuramate dehydrogenase